MTTLAEMKVLVARDLSDADMLTFTDAILGDLINAALVEVGRIVPVRFREDITPVANQLRYVLRSDTFDGVVVPEMELTQVELWDTSQTPEEPVKHLTPGSYLPLGVPQTSDSGWTLWGGQLELTWASVVNWITGHEDDYVIRVWGYSPYPPVVADDDLLAVSTEVEQMIRTYAGIEALDRLTSSRILYTQWQTRQNATDVSMASLMGDLSNARANWRIIKRENVVLRERPR